MSENSSGRDNQINNIVVGCIIVYVLYLIGDCKRERIVDNIMEDGKYRRENNIRNREDAEEKADEIIDANSDRRE
jgi:hypothetical protein